MKKNKMMRLAAILLVGVLFTTSVIGGTFAKYVTTESGSDTARVAKFGVTVEADSFTMFKTDYEKTDTSATLIGTNSVSSSDGDKLLAPGTSGSFGTIAITGTPEVAVDVAIVATVEVLGNWIIDGDFYCPIVVTVGTEEISGLDFTSAGDFAAAIKAEIDGKSKQYDPKTDLGTIYNNTNLDLAWAWAFEGAAGSKQTDELDTKLGDRAVAEDLTISIGVAITVTQID
ncbi:MAG: hypothetical protein IKV39_05305 [Clostridia bacterium]|nr:hypothetical protein [Clostridia bacterium]